MSLIFQIKSRRAEDLVNEGFRASLTGELNAGVDQVVLSCPSDRLFAVAAVVISTNDDTPGLVQVGFKSGVLATSEFIRVFLAADGDVLEHSYAVGDWRYGALGHNLVITTAVHIAYTIDCRIISEPAALGYIAREGAIGHSHGAVYPSESGRERGQSEF